MGCIKMGGKVKLMLISVKTRYWKMGIKAINPLV